MLPLPGVALGAGLMILPPSQWCEPADMQWCLSTLPGLPRGPPASGTVSGERLRGRRAPACPGWHELIARCGCPRPLLSSCLAGKGAPWGVRHGGNQALVSDGPGRGSQAPGSHTAPRVSGGTPHLCRAHRTLGDMEGSPKGRQSPFLGVGCFSGALMICHRSQGRRKAMVGRK